MSIDLRRLAYIAVCAIVLLLWIWFGHFDSIEAPYVGF
jgi:hypothetical protein